jgi:hypothetical protein
MTTDFSHTDRLARLIQLKHDLLAQLHALARKQVEVVAADEVHRLMAILAQKQPLLNQLQAVEQALDPFRREDADQRAWAGAQARRACQVVADRANVLLAELMQLERQAEVAVTQCRDRTASELATATSALAARKAYVGGPAPLGQAASFSSEG